MGSRGRHKSGMEAAGNARPIAGYQVHFCTKRYVCRRSWQFCLSADRQQISFWLDRHRIPREIQREILSYLPPDTANHSPISRDIQREQLTYLPSLHGERCLDCENMDEDSASTHMPSSVFTCLDFENTDPFHKNELNQWSLCRTSRYGDCKGHTRLQRPSCLYEFTLFIEKEASTAMITFRLFSNWPNWPGSLHIRLHKARMNSIQTIRMALIYFEIFATETGRMTGGLGGLRQHAARTDQGMEPGI
ncbi:hypothetical protein CEK25_004975 [Fusarium fujikuroi]|nr:hypothetical protein CEK25_004975 [Fusarium fujikuroi]